MDLDGSGLRVTIGQTGQVTTTGGGGLFLRSTGSIFIDNAGYVSSTNVGWINAGQTDGSALIGLSYSGTISSTGFGVRLDPGTSAVDGVNTGTISGTGWGVRISDSATGSVDFVNSGEILTVDANAFNAGATVDTLRNSGLLVGDVELGAGSDTLKNQGAITGPVDLGEGADSYRGFGGFVADTVSGGSGNDTLIGGSDTDALAGGADDDSLRGRGGDDDLDGGAGKDILRGGDGHDWLVGGLRRDLQTAGDGSDSFVYLEVADSAQGGDIDKIRELHLRRGTHPPFRHRRNGARLHRHREVQRNRGRGALPSQQSGPRDGAGRCRWRRRCKYQDTPA